MMTREKPDRSMKDRVLENGLGAAGGSIFGSIVLGCLWLYLEYRQPNASAQSGEVKSCIAQVDRVAMQHTADVVLIQEQLKNIASKVDANNSDAKAALQAVSRQLEVTNQKIDELTREIMTIFKSLRP